MFDSRAVRLRSGHCCEKVVREQARGCQVGARYLPGTIEARARLLEPVPRVLTGRSPVLQVVEIRQAPLIERASGLVFFGDWNLLERLNRSFQSLPRLFVQAREGISKRHD